MAIEKAFRWWADSGYLNGVSLVGRYWPLKWRFADGLIMPLKRHFAGGTIVVIEMAFCWWVDSDP